MARPLRVTLRARRVVASIVPIGCPLPDVAGQIHDIPRTRSSGSPADQIRVAQAAHGTAHVGFAAVRRLIAPRVMPRNSHDRPREAPAGRLDLGAPNHERTMTYLNRSNLRRVVALLAFGATPRSLQARPARGHSPWWTLRTYLRRIARAPPIATHLPHCSGSPPSGACPVHLGPVMLSI